jgi:hypothetical protein
MAYTVTLSLTTLAEIALAGTFISAVIYVSRKSSPAGNVGKEKTKGKKKKKSSSALPDAGPNPVPPVETLSQEVMISAHEKKKKKQITQPKTPPPPLPLAPAPLPPSLASIITPPSLTSIITPKATPIEPTKIGRTVKPERKNDMRDYELEPEVETPRVMKIVDAPSTEPSEEWLAWANKDNSVYDEDNVVEASWEVAKPKSLLFFPVTIP